MRLIMMAVLTLFLAGCGDDPRDLTYGEYQALSAEAREEVDDELDREEVNALNAGAAHVRSSQPGSVPIEQMTLEQLIDKGEEVAESID